MTRIAPHSKLLVLVLALGALAARGAGARPVDPLAWGGDYERQVLRHAFGGAGAPPPAAPTSERQRSLVEMTGRMQKVVNVEAHRIVQEGRRAALDSYRQQVRLLTPEALAAARREAVDWSAPDSRPRAETAAAEVYARGEAAARLAGIEASEKAWKQGYQRARQAARGIAAEYARELDDQIRKAAIEAMLQAYRRGGRDRAQRAVAERDQLVARMKREAAAKVATRLAEAERNQMARLQRSADAAGLIAYAAEEEQAYAEAHATIEADQPAVTVWREEAAAPAMDPAPAVEESFLFGMSSRGR